MNLEAYRAILGRLGVEENATLDPPARRLGADIASVARLLAMPLDVFARTGQPVEVRVKWWPETLFFVPDVRHAEALCRNGIARVRGLDGR